MMNETALRVALYARVSSDHQAKAATIKSQLSALEDRIAQDNHVLDGELRFLDDGYSGSTLLRPALEQLRDVAYAGVIDILYVHSPDRLARRYAYQVLLIEEFKKAGVEIVFLNHAINDSPEDELLLQMQGMIAEYERAKIMERSRRGKRHAARRGSVNVLSGAPYGYRYVSVKETGGDARYEIISEEAKVAVQVYEWIGRDSLSIGEVRRRLHEQGIKTKTGKEWWDRATIWGMLKNPAYKGSAGFRKTHIGERLPQLRPQRGQAEQPRKAYSVYATPIEEQEFIPVPALVSEELFDAVAEQLAENKKRYRQGRRGAKYLLQGLLKCACCGYTFYGKPSRGGRANGKTRRYTYYRCIGMDAYRFGGNRICDNKQVRTSVLEEAVWEDVSDLLRDPERIQKEYQRRLTNDDESGLALKQNEITINKVKRAIARLIDAYKDDLITKKEFEPRVRQSKNRLTQLQEEQAKLLIRANEQEELRSVINHLDEFAKKLTDGIEKLSWSDKREVIRALVKRVEVGKEEVRVVYKIGQLPFVHGPASGASLQHCWRREHPSLGGPQCCGLHNTVLQNTSGEKLLNQTQNVSIRDHTR
jgi:site-specific DNA recombinase